MCKLIRILKLVNLSLNVKVVNLSLMVEVVKLSLMVTVLAMNLSFSHSFFEPLHKAEQNVFGIRHFTGRVVYNASDFLSCNRDVLPDDVVCVFSRNNCNFGFVSYLFSAEIRASSGVLMCVCICVCVVTLRGDVKIMMMVLI